MVDGCQSKLVNILSGVPQGSVLDQLSFLLYTSKLFSILENKLIGYAEDKHCCGAIPKRQSTVAESMIRDLGRVSEWVVWSLVDEIEC